MPIISFTPADKMLAIIINEAAFYTATISKIDGPKASASGKSVNFFFSFSICGGKYEGKEIDVAFSSGTNPPGGPLGSMMWMPTAYMRQVYAAVKGIPVTDVPDQFDTDELKNQKLDVKVDVSTGEGGLFNTISQFLPTGKGAASALPF